MPQSHCSVWHSARGFRNNLLHMLGEQYGTNFHNKNAQSSLDHCQKLMVRANRTVISCKWVCVMIRIGTVYCHSRAGFTRSCHFKTRSTTHMYQEPRLLLHNLCYIVIRINKKPLHAFIRLDTRQLSNNVINCFTQWENHKCLKNCITTKPDMGRSMVNTLSRPRCNPVNVCVYTANRLSTRSSDHIGCVDQSPMTQSLQSSIRPLWFTWPVSVCTVWTSSTPHTKTTPVHRWPNQPRKQVRDHPRAGEEDEPRQGRGLILAS